MEWFRRRVYAESKADKWRVRAETKVDQWRARRRTPIGFLQSLPPDARCTKIPYCAKARKYGIILPNPKMGCKPPVSLRRCGAEPGEIPALALSKEGDEEDNRIH